MGYGASKMEEDVNRAYTNPDGDFDAEDRALRNACVGDITSTIRVLTSWNDHLSRRIKASEAETKQLRAEVQRLTALVEAQHTQ